MSSAAESIEPASETSAAADELPAPVGAAVDEVAVAADVLEAAVEAAPSGKTALAPMSITSSRAACTVCTAGGDGGDEDDVQHGCSWAGAWASLSRSRSLEISSSSDPLLYKCNCNAGSQ